MRYTEGTQLIEISTPPEKLFGLKNCLGDLKEKIDYLSYYVPSDLLLQCAQGQVQSCSELEKLLFLLTKMQLFDSFSFDRKGLSVMQKFRQNLGGKSYHSWGFTDIEEVRLSDLKLVIFNSDSMLNQN